LSLGKLAWQLVGCGRESRGQGGLERAMGSIHRRHIDHPGAWTAAGLGGKAGLVRPLDAAHLDAFEAFLAATRGQPALEVRRETFHDAGLDDLGRWARREVRDGRGAVILSGLDPQRFGADGYRRIYWLLGQHLGQPALQSERGDVLGFVRQETDNPFGRGYISNTELGFHTDFHEILSLASVQTADRGGESGLVSSLTLHNMLLARRPDVLETLYEGWFDGLDAYYQIFKPKAELSAGRLPYFGLADGRVSLHQSLFNDRAAKERDLPYPPAIQEALAVLAAMANEPGVAARFVLEPGEMLFWHNWTTMHARSRFENGPGRERMLMRLWLHAHEPRPAPAAIFQRALAVDHIHQTLGAEGRAMAG
jgi:hypothetical protein